MKKLIEKVDYELIPSPEEQDAWAVRILTGDFTESVVVFNAIAFNEVKDCLTFNFHVISSPDSGITADSPELQKYAAKLLEDIIEHGLEEGFVQIEDKDASES